MAEDTRRYPLKKASPKYCFDYIMETADFS